MGEANPNLRPDLSSSSLAWLELADANLHHCRLNEHFKRYPWVLDTLLYRDTGHLLEILPEAVIRRAEAIIDAQVAARA